MTGNPRQIILDLFGKEQLEDISIEELKDMVKEFPSFNALHYLLSKKLKSEGHDEFYQETEKTALYFTNPFWLQWLLQDEEEKKVNEFESPAASEIVNQFEHISAMATAGEMNSIPFAEAPVMRAGPVIAEVAIEGNGFDIWRESEKETQISGVPEEHPVQEELHAHEQFEPQIEKREEEIVPEFTEMNVGIQDPDEMMVESMAEIALAKIDAEVEKPYYHPAEEMPVENNELVEEIQDVHVSPAPEPVAEADMDEPRYAGQESVLEDTPAEPQNPIQRPYYFWEKEFYSKSEASIPSPAPIEPPAETDTLFEKEKEPVDSGPEEIGDHVEENDASAVSMEIALEKEHPAENLVIFEQDPIVFASSPPIENESKFDHPAETENAFIPKVETENAETMLGATEPDEELKFEPYHTIDYFASQGIKYEQEENPTDKFGKQLKSFTAWLKTMKRLPKAGLESEMSDITEAAIQSIAEHSIEEKEVITEAMAEVLVLQGKTDKAVELYNKLSLLNPSKSAFFAARIEQIKAN